MRPIRFSPKKEDEYKSFMSVDDDDDDCEDDYDVDELESTTLRALRDVTPINVLHFWRALYNSSLDSACLEGSSATNLSKLKSAIYTLKCKSDILVIMEYVIHLRVAEEPFWPGAEVRNPTLGLFASSERLALFLGSIMSSETWASRRAKYALIHMGSMRGLKTVLTKKEFVELSKFLPSQ